MRSEVSVELATGQVFSFDLGEGPPMPQDQARQWLDQQFLRLDCEPLRATGKLLLADKVLVVARDAGPRRLADPEWGLTFARAAAATLGKPVIHVDLTAMTLAF